MPRKRIYKDRADWESKNQDKLAKYDNKKACEKYHAKKKKKRIAAIQVKYHKESMTTKRNFHPFENGTWINQRTDTTFDHYHPSLYQNLWMPHAGFYYPDREQMKINIAYVLELQRVKRIPLFIVESIDTYMNQIELRKFYQTQWDELVGLYQIKATDKEKDNLREKQYKEYAEKAKELLDTIYLQRKQIPAQ